MPIGNYFIVSTNKSNSIAKQKEARGRKESWDIFKKKIVQKLLFSLEYFLK